MDALAVDATATDPTLPAEGLPRGSRECGLRRLSIDLESTIEASSGALHHRGAKTVTIVTKSVTAGAKPRHARRRLPPQIRHLPSKDVPGGSRERGLGRLRIGLDHAKDALRRQDDRQPAQRRCLRSIETHQLGNALRR